MGKGNLMKGSMKNVLILAAILTPHVALAHSRFARTFPDPSDPQHVKVLPSTTPPRNDSTGLKIGPCGQVPRTATPMVYKPGQEITVHWEETINHPGYFKISFSKEKDENFEVLIPKIVDTNDNPIENAQYHSYEAKVTLPNVVCEDCTLQLIQHMDDNPTQEYYSCSDIQLLNDVPAPTSTPTSTTVPSDSGTSVKTLRTARSNPIAGD